MPAAQRFLNISIQLRGYSPASPITLNVFMRSLLLLPLALLAACSTAPTELDPISYQCQQQLDAYREQPALRDPKGQRPPLPVAPISDACDKELKRKGVDRPLR